jgi:hypothetical protein
VVRELKSVVPVDPLYSEPPSRSTRRSFISSPVARSSQLPSTRIPVRPSTDFTGFELGFAFATVIRQGEAWDRTQRLVTAHDRSGVDELIISAGAPTKQGLAFPSDGVLASLVLSAAEERALEATHIRRIFVHAWQGRGIAALTPNETGVELVCGEMPGA